MENGRAVSVTSQLPSSYRTSLIELSVCFSVSFSVRRSTISKCPADIDVSGNGNGDTL